MKICILSDSHDRADLLEHAVRAGAAAGAELGIHCGDVIGANTLRAAARAGLPLHVIHGNNLGDPAAMHALANEAGSLVHYHGADARLDLSGRRIFVVHYPDYGHAMACTGLWDLVCCGHSHKAAIEQVVNVKGGRTWLVNPGTVAGLSAPATWILGDLEKMEFALHHIQSGH